MPRRFTAVACAFAALVATTAQAQDSFKAKLTAASEVPPNASAGKGAAMLTLDPATRILTYAIDYSDLTGPLAAAHIHGPAAADANAPPVVPLPSTPSPIRGSATLTEAQAADLKAGNWYVNLHTAANPGGEIRGQLAAE